MTKIFRIEMTLKFLSILIRVETNQRPDLKNQKSN
jgi:hypothetical protein